MVFSSAIFLCLFLPIVCLLNRLLPGIRSRNALLIAASLVFYAFGNPAYLLLLLTSVICNYLAGLHVSRETAGGKAALVLAITVNLGLLGVFKYLGFLMRNMSLLFPDTLLFQHVPDIALPVGISFFTFQGLSYVIDVYRDNSLRCRSFPAVLLYISLFPQLVAGPIVKYRDVAAEIYNRDCTAEDTAQGLRRFILGLSKKLLLADVAGEVVTLVFSLDAADLDIRLAWLGAIAYTLQIYFDFSGYSDMAIGLGRLFGFHFRENFQHPYAASSIRDFWRRWHISLSSWFRDYLYIPLGGNRKGIVRMYINRLLVFFCTGLWHGANWTFVLWGLWHGVALVVEDRLSRAPERKPFNRLFGRLCTLLVVILGFVLFRADTLSQAGVMFVNLFVGFRFTPESTAALATVLNPRCLCTLIAGCALSLPLLPVLREKTKPLKWVDTLTYPATLLLFAVAMCRLSAASYVPFIYFQF